MPSSPEDPQIRTLSFNQAAQLCVESDLNAAEHYPTDAFSVLAKLAEDMGVSTDFLIAEAHWVRKRDILGQTVTAATTSTQV